MTNVRCKGVNKNGKRCNNKGGFNNGYCLIHQSQIKEDKPSLFKRMLPIFAIIISFGILFFNIYFNVDKFYRSRILVKIGLRYEGYFLKITNVGQKDIDNLGIKIMIWGVNSPGLGEDKVVNVGLLPAKHSIEVYIEPFKSSGYQSWNWINNEMTNGDISGLIVPIYKGNKSQKAIAFFMPGQLKMNDYELFYKLEWSIEDRLMIFPSIECDFPKYCPIPTSAVNYPDIFYYKNSYQNYAWQPQNVKYTNDINGKWKLYATIEHPSYKLSKEEILNRNITIIEDWEYRASEDSYLEIDTLKNEFNRVANSGRNIEKNKIEIIGNQIIQLHPQTTCNCNYGMDFTVLVTERNRDTLILTYSTYANNKFVKEKYIKY